MQGFHSARTGALESDVSDVIATALARLRECRVDSLDVFVLCDELPELILPGLAYAASRRAYPRELVKILVKYCGPLFLERCLGRRRARELIARYQEDKTLSGL